MCTESSRQEAQLEGEGQTGGCHVFFFLSLQLKQIVKYVFCLIQIHHKNKTFQKL